MHGKTGSLYFREACPPLLISVETPREASEECQRSSVGRLKTNQLTLQMQLYDAKGLFHFH